jgi:hypothetical protein
MTSEIIIEDLETGEEITLPVDEEKSDDDGDESAPFPLQGNGDDDPDPPGLGAMEAHEPKSPPSPSLAPTAEPAHVVDARNSPVVA